MIAAAHAVAISLYLAAVLVAALPFAKRVRAPVGSVTVVLALGLAFHAAALASLARNTGVMALTGLGPSLSFAGFTVAAVLLLVELSTRDVTLTFAAAPLAAIATGAGNLAGLRPFLDASGARGVWLTLHIVAAFIGLAAYAAAAAAGTMYLVAHRDLKSRRFGAVFRFFPPLATLDRVNHVATLGGFLGLTLGIALAASYSVTYKAIVLPQVVWGTAAWLGVTALTLGRLRGTLQPRRAALLASVTFAIVIGLYIIVRLGLPGRGQFL